MWASRSLLYPLAGLGSYDYGRMPVRYFMEFPVQLIGFTIIVALVHVVNHLKDVRDREIHTAQLESALARAQLQNLRLQLQPHFLFNALNTISATMYEDARAADEMLGRLAELLRASLRTAQTDEVPLSTEIESLQAYLAIMRARFGSRLTVRLEIDEDCDQDLVPSLLLQPLVENAIRHGRTERDGEGVITVRAARKNERLELEVEDDGPGVDDRGDLLSSGIGLSSTAERLRLLYGDAARFTAGNRAGGGFVVAASIPVRHSGGLR